MAGYGFVQGVGGCLISRSKRKTDALRDGVENGGWRDTLRVAHVQRATGFGGLETF